MSSNFIDERLYFPDQHKLYQLINLLQQDHNPKFIFKEQIDWEIK